MAQGDRISYEHPGAPRAPRSAEDKPIGGYREEGFLWSAYRKGNRLGTIASSDHCFRAHIVENLQVEVGSILTYDATLEVGAVTETVTVEATTPLVETSRGGGDVTIAGGRTRAAGVFIDGVINSRTGIGATITELSTPIDAISEVRVEASAPTAELGRSAAGFINSSATTSSSRSGRTTSRPLTSASRIRTRPGLRSGSRTSCCPSRSYSHRRSS